MALTRNTELRKVPPVILMPVARILQENDSWKTLMAHIPGENRRPKYTAEHIKMIENASMAWNRPSAEILFSEWGTSGKIRPTLIDLVETLKIAQLYRAADTVSESLLNEPPVERPTSGPAARVNISLRDILGGGESVKSYLNAASYPDSSDLNMLTNNLNPNLDRPQAKDSYSKANILLNKSNNSIPAQPKSNVSYNAEIPLTNDQNETEIARDTTSNSFQIEIPDISMLMKSTNLTAAEIAENPTIVEASQIEIPDLSTLMRTTGQSATDIPDFGILMKSEEQNENIQSGEPIILSSESNTSNSVSSHAVSSQSFEMPILSKFQSEVKTKLIEFRTLETATKGFDNSCLIGRGGSGSIYLATGLFDVPVAVKKLSTHDPKNRTEARLCKRFVAETNSLSYCKHENIVSLLGYSTDGPNYCLVLEYLDGGTLQENISKSENFYAFTRMNIAMGIAKGIEYLHCYHESPLIHRDIKSANILLTKSKIPKLCDFGIIKHASEENATSSIMGTSTYMAPEALRGDLSVKVDIFSYGVVLLELLTGLPPHDDNRDNYDIISYVKNHSNDKIDQLLDVRAGNWNSSNDLYQIAKMCLRTSVDDRPFIVDVIKLLNKII